MKWRNSKERELIASGGSREQTLPTKNNPNPDLSDPKPGSGMMKPVDPLDPPSFQLPPNWPPPPNARPSSLMAAAAAAAAVAANREFEPRSSEDEYDGEGGDDEEEDEEINVT